MPLITIGDRLKEARERKNFKQTQVMAKTGINNKTLSGYEKGVSEPDLDTLNRLADLYEVSVDWLTGRKGNQPPKTSITSKQTEHVLQRMIEHYNIDVSDPEKVEKLEQIIQLVFPLSK